MGYADDTYGLGTSLRSLQGALEQTQLWLCLTGQDVNGKKSVAFTTEKKSSTVDLIISGASIPQKEEFRCLGGGNPATQQCKNGNPTSRQDAASGGTLVPEVWSTR